MRRVSFRLPDGRLSSIARCPLASVLQEHPPVISASHEICTLARALLGLAIDATHSMRHGGGVSYLHFNSRDISLQLIYNKALKRTSSISNEIPLKT